MGEEQGSSKRVVKVTVTFPIAQQGQPYRAEHQRTDTVSDVRSAAMGYFNVADEGGSTFYLTRDGERLDGGSTIAEVAGHAAAVKFTLTKEIIQG